MIRWRFGSALHWYQVLIVMAEQEVDTWIWNMTSAVSAPPDNTNGTKNAIPTEVKLHSSDMNAAALCRSLLEG
jgi:hypothetical protein